MRNRIDKLKKSEKKERYQNILENAQEGIYQSPPGGCLHPGIPEEKLHFKLGKLCTA
jgi:hypothetical protein